MFNKIFIFLYIISLSTSLKADNTQTTYGKCSSNIINNEGNITINCKDENIAPFFFLDLSCHAYYYKNSDPDESINNFFNFLKKNDGRMVVVEYLISPPTFCASIDTNSLPKKDVVQRFKDWDESYASLSQAFVYENKEGNMFRFNIDPEDTHNSNDAATLSNDCGHACAHWKLIGNASTSYLSGDSSNIGIIEIAPSNLKFSERYLNTMDEVSKLKNKLSDKMSFSFTKN